MKEEMSFEELINKKADEIRLHPSNKIWEVLQKDLARTFHPTFNFSAIIFLFGLFSIISLRVAEHDDAFIKITSKNGLHHNIPTETFITDTKNKEILELEQQENKHFIAPVGHEKADDKYDSLHEFMTNSTQLKIERHDNRKESDFINQDVVDVSPTKNHIHQLSYTTTVGNIENNHRQNLRIRQEVNAVQFYFAPSVGFRFFMDGEQASGSNRNVSNDSASIYLPSSGVEAGVALWKPINDKWAIKSGIQVNMSKYEIRPIQSTFDLGFSKSGETSTMHTSLNSNGQRLSGIKLMNQNFRFSVPIEVEYKLAGNKELSVFMSGSLQPSFTIYSNGSIITSEFKDQVPVDPYLYRRFNILTGLECFFRLNAGYFDIQAGPQIRYQLLSNNLGASPYREHIMDYSMKIGIVKKIP
jgi:hypothetical protein